MRIFLKTLILMLLFAAPGKAMEQKWVDDLNRRFPGIGDEFRQAVQQKLAQHEETTTVEALIDKLIASPNYTSGKITNAQSFSLHSELMLLHPAVGHYQESLQEAKLLRDFVLKYSAEDERVVQTFRGVFEELLIINGEYETALHEIEETISLDPDEEGNYLSRGVAHVKSGQLAEALEDLGILIQKPEAEKSAHQLFGFIMANRQTFQEVRVQKNTMIDVMLRDLDPTSGRRVKIPANLEDEQKPDTRETTPAQTVAKAPETPEHSSSPPPSPPEKAEHRLTDIPSLEQLVTFTPEALVQTLGTPVIESKGDQTVDRDYNYQGHTITITFDKAGQKIVSVQMFFLPPVDETTAREQIGLEQLDIAPTIDSGMLKVWSPYGNFSKVRFSLNEGQVIAVMIEP